ncbi:MAG: HNH endonuclease [Chloroflexota bacterium]
MPKRAGKPCGQPGCAAVVAAGQRYCEAHKRAAGGAYNERRGSRHQRGYDCRWVRVRRIHLAEYPLCADCLEQEQVTAAKEVHHIKKLAEGGTHLPDNLMSLCKSCHSRRTNRGE